ncbi:UDP-N-acetylglucosamine 2-epimerase [Cellulomonas sp. NPDC057328]|uniref:UDP-N-acetylglucosamine 2-epimerase n=1 Tax=Cellulomonas sp. NPDC057328 TaxID=3346101 RepID=UPI003628D010
MIAFIVGTTAELIKIAPVYHELSDRGRDVEIWYTGQHVEELPAALGDLDLPRPAVWLVPERGARNLARPVDAPRWALRLARTVLSQRGRLRARLRRDGRQPWVLVHGDTFTAPLGALVGRLLGARVGHVEAGMRSGSLLHPFPEEVNRRVAAHLVDVHFAPSANEAHNLRHRRGAVVVTGANTIVDAVRFALSRPSSSTLVLPERYAVATLHRFELVSKEDLYRTALELLRDASRNVPIVYFAGASERERIAQYGLDGLFDGERFRIEQKLSYVDFMPVLARAQYVVTDSGGLQEESNHLGIPCAIHRAKTERHEGEGSQMVLTRYDAGRLRRFLETYEQHRIEPSLDDFHPSRQIADTVDLLGA